MNILKRIDLDNPKKTTESFIYQCMPVLAHVRGSTPSDIISKLKENKEYDIYGDRYSGLDILRLWRFFYETNPSTYLPCAATKCTAISSGVPIVMLAYKHQHDINYEHWRGDKYTKLMMPKSLGFLVGEGSEKALEELKQYGEDLAGLATKWPVATLRAYVEDFLTDPGTGTPFAGTSYKAFRVGDNEFDSLTSKLKRMLLQTWVYHPSVRHKNMITNPSNWDELAEPLYEVDGLTSGTDPWKELLSEKHKPSKPDANDLPW